MSEKQILLSVLFLELLIPGNLRNVIYIRDRRGCDRMVVGFTTTYALTTDVVSSNLDQGGGCIEKQIRC
jgi:hypothetical protein